MKKIIPVLIALLLIFLIGGVTFGRILIEKYSYSKERVDLGEYFQVTGEEAAMILQDEMTEEKALVRNGICYFDLETVHRYLDETFYADEREGLLLYAGAREIWCARFGESTMLSYDTAWDLENVGSGNDGSGKDTARPDTADAEPENGAAGGNADTGSGNGETGGNTPSLDGARDLGYVPVFAENGTVYVAADYVKQYVNFSYELYERHVQVNTAWDVVQLASLEKDTALRLKGGIKSPILRDLEKGEQVEVLEQMETWSKVKTADSFIGYVENRQLSAKTAEVEIPVTEAAPQEYTSLRMEGKVSLGWHAIGGSGGNDTLESMAAGAQGLNVIAPTWFSLSDNEGNFSSYATKGYVEKAHALGLKVWGVLDDFNYAMQAGASGVDIDGSATLSSTKKRMKLVENIVQAALDVGMDGVNVDFERINAESGPHYIQFLRELSVYCRKNGLTLSVDNYVPFDFNDYYRLDIQGKIVDYVIIMGYDEHWSGSGDPGSVASIDYVQNGIRKTAQEVPAEKIVNGVPLYAILWKIDGMEVTDEYLTVRNTEDFLKQVGAEPVWDEEVCQYYLEWSKQDVTYKIWLEEARSIEVKLNVMSVQGIGGVAVWRLGYGTHEIWKLINTYVQG
ncbi:MAG: chitinase [Clostridium sp.]|jgi:spore germination protein YaaH|nr:chitinase [Clostridium sp.]